MHKQVKFAILLLHQHSTSVPLLSLLLVHFAVALELSESIGDRFQHPSSREYRMGGWSQWSGGGDSSEWVKSMAKGEGIMSR